MKSVAILIDGEWFRRSLESALNKSLPNGVTAEIMYKNALLALDEHEILFRIFYYDCPPCAGKHTNPVDHSRIDFKLLKKYQARSLFLAEMKRLDYVAMRLGVAKHRGWTFTNSFTKQALAGASKAPTATDIYLSFEQKGVDMRIGIDVATLSLKKIVERIILISGDTDMIPAMKLARREGVQVILVEVLGANSSPLAKSLDEDADLVRSIKPFV